MMPHFLHVFFLLSTIICPPVCGWSRSTRIKHLSIIRHAIRLQLSASTDIQQDTNEPPAPPSSPATINYGLNDEEFEAWIQSELFQDPLYKDYPTLFEQGARAITNWRKRYRGNPRLWRRLFKKERVLKEFVEAVPILNAVVQLLKDNNEPGDNPPGNYTIIDLASGKGYLSMFLSEILSPEKVNGIVLMDKAWPRQDQPMKDHHISWEHIYGNSNTTGSYYDTWPIPLVTSKQDLKAKATHRALQKRFFDKAPGPILLLAVHLCGTLSLKAIDMFNDNPHSISFLALKPCCLPPMVHARREEIFQIGQHRFPAQEVCSNGRFNNNKWYGPPRWHLQNKFQLWAEHLYQGVEEEKKGRVKVTVQQDGGYQNAFVFAQRQPVSETVWEGLERETVSSFLVDNNEGKEVKTE